MKAVDSGRRTRSRTVMAFACALGLSTLAGCASGPTLGEVEHPKTKDGWELAIEHVAPPGGVARKARPVILCHGLIARRTFWSLDGDQSLPKLLARHGYDVWMIDMRGRPGTDSGDAPDDYTIDDIIKNDLDAAITHVLSKTGAHDVTWIGHSLGGMVAYARLGTLGDARVAQLITVASPIYLAPLSRNLVRADLMSPGLIFTPTLPMRMLAGMEGTLKLSLAPRGLGDSFYAEENLPVAGYRQLEREGVANASANELRQLLHGALRGEFMSADGKTSYARGLKNIRVPTLVMVGRADELADPLVGRQAFEHLGSSDKELVIAGRAEGFSTDFGHVDLLLGKPAQHDVFPKILDWLERHDGH